MEWYLVGMSEAKGWVTMLRYPHLIRNGVVNSLSREPVQPGQKPFIINDGETVIEPKA